MVGETRVHIGRSRPRRRSDELRSFDRGAQRNAEKHHGESATPPKSASGEDSPGHTETAPESGRESGGGESAAHRAGETSGERVFGIDTESPALVVAAVVVSLLLATGLWLSSSVVVALVVAAFGLASAIFDVREVFHQLVESRPGLTAIAALVAALHLAALVAALVLARRSTRRGDVAL
jgi:hypothetical protein